VYLKSERLCNVTLPEWLTGSPAISTCERLGFARVCSNRTGDDFFPQFYLATGYYMGLNPLSNIISYELLPLTSQEKVVIEICIMIRTHE
jgi:hypothetical protein